MAYWLLVGSDFGFLSDAVSTWLAYGIGLGAVAWLIGQVVGLLYRLTSF